jgi:hypothetical protein
MSENPNNEKISKTLLEAKDKLEKLAKPEYSDVVSKIQYLIASYNHDKNPIGLYEVAPEIAGVLKKVKAASPNKVSQKLIDELEKAASAPKA